MIFFNAKRTRGERYSVAEEGKPASGVEIVSLAKVRKLTKRLGIKGDHFDQMTETDVMFYANAADKLRLWDRLKDLATAVWGALKPSPLWLRIVLGIVAASAVAAAIIIRGT